MNFNNQGMNCITNIQCEPKTKRLSLSSYNRPKEGTLTDSLQTKAGMREKLKNYRRVEDIDDVPLNTHVRYVTLKNKKQRFCLGGLLKRKHSKYVVLSNGSFTWSVQRYHWAEDSSQDDDSEPVFETVFFRILSKEDQHQRELEEKNKEIEQLKSALLKSRSRN